MVTEKVKGSDARYWDFAAGDKDANGVSKGDWVRKPVEVDVQLADPKIEGSGILDDILQVAGGDMNKVRDLFNAGIKAQATEQAGSTPAGTFSPSMVAAADAMLRQTPQFSTIKKSSERRRKIMEFIGGNEAFKNVYLQTLEPIRDKKDSDEPESE